MKYNQILQGDVSEIAKTLPSQSVNCIVTSPPYWGLRDYGTAEWEGGDAACDHIEKNIHNPDDTSTLRNDGRKNIGTQSSDGIANMAIQYKTTCAKCGARRIDKQLGMEETPEAYANNLVAVFRELRRVLRDDGTLWLNLGDSYNTTPPGNKGFHYGKGRSAQGILETGHKGLISTLKPKDLVGIPWRVAFALQADGWYLRSDIIWAKCLSGGTVVYAKTEKGETPMTIKDLTRLAPSKVKLWTGEKWSRILGWKEVKPDIIPNHKGELQKRRSHKHRTGEILPLEGNLEIHLRSGEKIGCTQDHRFPTQRGLIEARDLKPGDILKSCLLPESKNPISPQYLPDEIGWWVGLYLAEGSRSGKTLQISGHVKEVDRWEKLKKLTDDYGGYFRLYNHSGKGANAHIDSKVLLAITNLYINGKLGKGKHLAPECWRRSNEFLSQVLQGYLDGDGHFDKGNNRWRVGFTKNDALAQDLRTLAGRLGFSLRLKRAKHSLKGKKYNGWRGQVKFEQSNHHNTRSDNEVISIEASRARKFWDIAIEDEPHLFALASGILTHNSNPMPESVTDRPTKSHEYIFLLTKSARYYYDQEAVKEPGSLTAHGGGRQSGIRYSDQSGRNDKGQVSGYAVRAVDVGGRNKRSVWGIAEERDPLLAYLLVQLAADDPKRLESYLKQYGIDATNKDDVFKVSTRPYSGAHFAVFPPTLIEPCVLAGCPVKICVECGAPWERVIEEEKGEPASFNGSSFNRGKTHQAQSALSNVGKAKRTTNTKTIGFTPTCDCNAATRPGVVLDPFFGSGTVAEVAIKTGRNWLGIELNPEYIELAKKRIYETQPALFPK